MNAPTDFYMNDLNTIIAAAKSATVGQPVVLESKGRPLQTAAEVAIQPPPTPPTNPSEAYTVQIAREAEREFTKDEILGGQIQKRYPAEAFAASFHHTPRSFRKLLDVMGWQPTGKVAEAVEALKPLQAEYEDLVSQCERWSPARANSDFLDHKNRLVEEAVRGAKVHDELDMHSREHWHQNYTLKRKQLIARLEHITAQAIEPAKTILLDARAAFLEFAKGEESRLRAESAEWGHSLVMSHQWRIAIVAVIGFPGNRLPKVGYASPKSMLEGIVDL